MGKKKQSKNKKLVDKGILAVLVAFGIGIAALAFFMVSSLVPGKGENREAENLPEETASATEEPPVDEADLVRYTCLISDKETDGEGSEFSLEFNEKAGTYRELLNSGDSSSEIDRGTFQKEEDGIKTVSRRETKNTLMYDGNYLVSKNAMFEGTVPKGRTFKKKFTHEVDGESKIEIYFRRDGTFNQKVVKYSGGIDGKDTSEVMKGTYVHKGKFIERKRENGEKLMPYYVYKNKLYTSYYKKRGN